MRARCAYRRARAGPLRHRGGKAVHRFCNKGVCSRLFFGHHPDGVAAGPIPPTLWLRPRRGQTAAARRASAVRHPPAQAHSPPPYTHLPPPPGGRRTPDHARRHGHGVRGRSHHGTAQPARAVLQGVPVCLYVTWCQRSYPRPRPGALTLPAASTTRASVGRGCCLLGEETPQLSISSACDAMRARPCTASSTTFLPPACFRAWLASERTAHSLLGQRDVRASQRRRPTGGALGHACTHVEGSTKRPGARGRRCV